MSSRRERGRPAYPDVLTLGEWRVIEAVRHGLRNREIAAMQSVEDVRTAHSALEASGVKFTHAPHMVHRHADGQEEWMAVFDDNQGRPLAIMSTVDG